MSRKDNLLPVQWGCAWAVRRDRLQLAAQPGDMHIHGMDGSAPAMGTEVFSDTAGGFTVYYYSGGSGFTSPTWQGYASALLEVSPAIVNWLVASGFTLGTPLLTDANGDGVSLLMAYALGLDPSQNHSGAMPVPVLSSGTLGFSFYGASEGVTYTVEVSTDLITWSTVGVTLSAPHASGVRTAFVDATAAPPCRFLHLVISSSY